MASVLLAFGGLGSQVVDVSGPHTPMCPGPGLLVDRCDVFLQVGWLTARPGRNLTQVSGTEGIVSGVAWLLGCRVTRGVVLHD